MTVLQPFQLKRFFTKEQEQEMQKDLVSAFTGKVRIGTYSVVTESPGKKTDYYVGFVIEQPNNPHTFILTCLIEEKKKISKERFTKELDKIADNAHKLPQARKQAIQNLQSIFNR